MDNIQFWLYVAFGVIYFVVKQMRKKNAANEPQEGEQEVSQPSRKPVTFDELLKEFSQERRTIEDDQEDEVYEAPKPLIKVNPAKEDDQRRFADDESRRIYEESINQAEGYDLKFERDEHFKVKTPMKVDRERRREKVYRR